MSVSTLGTARATVDLPADPITQPETIHTTDPVYAEHVQRLKAARQAHTDAEQINGPPAPKPVPPARCTPASTGYLDQAKAIGCDLAKTTGGQTVLIGEYHDQMAQWEVLNGVVESLRAAGDTRPVIYISEIAPDDNTSNSFTQWNAMSAADRQQQKGHFADRYCGIGSPAAWRNSLYSMAKAAPGLTVRMGEADGLNRLSALAPDMKAYNIDLNYHAYATPDGTDNYADRDTAMAIAIAALRDANPDAIIIGRVGGSHLPEDLADNPDKPDQNILNNGLNGNDRLGEQLALLYGRDRVHTIATITPNRALYDDSSGQDVMTNDDGQIDYVINIPVYDLSLPWAPPAEWTTP